MLETTNTVLKWDCHLSDGDDDDNGDDYRYIDFNDGVKNDDDNDDDYMKYILISVIVSKMVIVTMMMTFI